MDALEFQRAERARDALAAEILGRPEIRMIDIGIEHDQGVPVVRVHLRDSELPGEAIPDRVGGIRVQIVRGDYELEDRAGHGSP